MLSVLAAANLKELHYQRDDGTRNIDALYSSCVRSGLIEAQAGVARETDKYERVFSVALDHMFGCWVIDFVEEVCGDRLLTSNDPTEAQLLDGEFVRRWCQKTLAQIEGELVAALKSDLVFQEYQGRQVAKDLGRVSMLRSVLDALDRIWGGGGHSGAAARCVP
jgi:hypothetical protein